MRGFGRSAGTGFSGGTYRTVAGVFPEALLSSTCGVETCVAAVARKMFVTVSLLRSNVGFSSDQAGEASRAPDSSHAQNFMAPSVSRWLAGQQARGTRAVTQYRQV